MIEESLFKDVDELRKLKSKQKSFLNDFFGSNRIWHNAEYLSNGVIAGSSVDPAKGVAILYKRVKQVLEHFEGIIEKDELRKILSIIVQENQVISYDRIELIKKHIEQGFYKDELEEIEKSVALETWGEDVWGEVFNGDF